MSGQVNEIKNDLKDERCCDFDYVLDQIKGLTWLPWIGNDYPKAQRKILVLGESHYCYNNHTPADIEQNREDTREVVADYAERGQDAGNQWKTYEPLETVLAATVLKNRTRLQIWSEIAYMNIIQKCMSDKKQRPHWELFLAGWKSVLQVIYAIKPDICICFSTDKGKNRNNFNRLEEFRDSLNFSYSIVKAGDTGEKISGANVATPGKITFEKMEVPVIFVHHASRIKRGLPQWVNVINQYV